jgi:O-antigen/teichoic acid export membrane protein
VSHAPLSAALKSGSAAVVDDPATRSTFIHGVSATFATRVVGVVIGLVTLTLTTRLLGPEGRGQFAVVMSMLAVVLQFSNAGLHSSATYFLSQQPDLRRPLGGLLFWHALFAVGAVALSAYAIVVAYPSLVPGVPGRMLAAALLTAPPAMFLMLAGNALLGLRSTTWFNGLDLGTKAIGLSTLMLLVTSSLTSFFVIYALLHVVLAAAAYVKLVGPTRPPFPTVALLRRMAGYASRIFLINAFMFLVLRIDLFLVNSFLGTADAGRYSVATQVAEMLNLVAASVAAILFPTLAAMTTERRWESTKRVAKVMGILLACVAIGVGVVSRPLFLALFGAPFAPAVIALWLLLPGLWCLGINSVLNQHLAAGGLPWSLVAVTLAAAIANVWLNVALLPRFGIAGAALASTLTYALLLVTTFLYLFTPGGREHRFALEVEH